MRAMNELSYENGMIYDNLPPWQQKYLDHYMKTHPTADMSVMGFIIGLTTRLGPDMKKDMEYLFTSGYCMYFGIMLKYAMGRGHLYMTAPSDHIVWGDEDGQFYDIRGLYTDWATEFILIDGTEMENSQNYKHVPYVGYKDDPYMYCGNFMERRCAKQATREYLEGQI